MVLPRGTQNETPVVAVTGVSSHFFMAEHPFRLIAANVCCLAICICKSKNMLFLHLLPKRSITQYRKNNNCIHSANQSCDQLRDRKLNLQDM